MTGKLTNMPSPGQRVEIEQIGEGTVTSITGDNEVEVAVSELETYRVSLDQLEAPGLGAE